MNIKNICLYTLILFCTIINVNNVKAISGDQIKEGWIDVQGKDEKTIQLENIYFYDKKGNKTNDLKINCTSLNPAGYEDMAGEKRYGWCEIGIYDTNIPTCTDTTCYKRDSDPGSLTVKITDSVGNSYDDFLPVGEKYMDFLRFGACSVGIFDTNIDEKSCAILYFNQEEKILPKGDYSIEITYSYNNYESTNISVDSTLKGSFTVSTQGSNDPLQSFPFLMEVYYQGTNELVTDEQITYYYRLYKNENDTQPIESELKHIMPTYTEEINSPPVNPVKFSVPLQQSKKVCIQAIIVQRGVASMPENKTKFCLVYSDDYSVGEYKWTLINDSEYNNMNKVTYLGKKKLEDYKNLYPKVYNFYNGDMNNINYPVFRVEIPRVGETVNSDSTNNNSTDNENNNPSNSDDKDESNTVTNTGSANIKFIDKETNKDISNKIDFSICTTENCSNSVVFNSDNSNSYHINNLKYDVDYYLLINAVPEEYNKPKKDIIEFTLNKNNPSHSEVISITKKQTVVVDDTLSNTSILLMIVSLIAIGIGTFLIFKNTRKKQEI